VYDISGKAVNIYRLEKGKLDVSNLARGIYFLKIEYDNKVFIDKFFIDRN